MPSVIAWLDQSAEHQRRARELVRLFSETEARDELGIGQIRDVFSNRLFPGVSVIQTRARYFLMVPWVFQLHEGRGRTGADLLRRVQNTERQFIEVLRAEGATRGLIGVQAGVNVKILPSAIYWGGLTQFGILTQPLAADELGRSSSFADLDPEATEELALRARSHWHRGLPDPPEGFPDSMPGGFTLTPEEAAWLREVIDTSSPGTLLSHLMQGVEAPAAASPWEDPVALSADGLVLEVLEDARLFSLAMHGAALLYNLLLAEAYVAGGFDAVGDQTDYYREALSDWVDQVQMSTDELARWDLDSWWAGVFEHNPRINRLTQVFVTEWVARTRAGGLAGLADDRGARELVANREYLQKKSQSRLRNQRLLRTWQGSSGAAPLVYRWGTVKDLVTDVVTAREVAGAPA